MVRPISRSGNWCRRNAQKSCRVLALMLLCSMAWAGQQNAIRSCYDIAHLTQTPAAVETALFVAIDQTTPLDDGLKQAVGDNIHRLRRPGVAFSIVRFSAYTQGYYTEVLVSGRLDPELARNERDDISKPLLAKFDNCVKYQVPFADKLIRQALQAGFSGTSSSVAKSDVLASLKDISALVRSSPARNKLVLIVSDMLENSSVTSFYSSQNVRLIDPAKELKLTDAAQLAGDFGGARVFVIGAGLLADNGKQSRNAYRDPKTMQALAGFWDGYFQKSHAELVEFGQPALLRPLQ